MVNYLCCYTSVFDYCEDTVLYRLGIIRRECHWAPQESYHGAPRPIEKLKDLDNLKFATTEKTLFMGFLFSEFEERDVGSEIDRLFEHSQSLTVPVEGEYFRDTDAGSPICDFPQQRPGSTRLRLTQSGSDYDREVLCPLQVPTTP